MLKSIFVKLFLLAMLFAPGAKVVQAQSGDFLLDAEIWAMLAQFKPLTADELVFANVTASPGENFSMDVEVVNAAAAETFTMRINYDPSVVDISDDPSQAVTRAPGSLAETWPTFTVNTTAQDGVIIIIASFRDTANPLAPPAPIVEGSGLLFTIHGTAIADAGASTQFELANNTGGLTPGAQSGGELVVDVQQVETPTPVAETPVPTETPVETPTPTVTPVEETPVPTETPVETPTPEETPVPTETPVETPTPEETPVPTETPVETPTPEETPTPTETPVETPTPEETPVPTETPVETPTPEETPTPTESPVETPTPEETPVPTETPVETPTPEETPTPTETPVETPTPEETPTPTESPVETPTPGEETPTPVEETPTPVEETPTPGEETPTPVEETPTPSFTPSPTLTATPTEGAVPTPTPVLGQITLGSGLLLTSYNGVFIDRGTETGELIDLPFSGLPVDAEVVNNNIVTLNFAGLLTPDESPLPSAGGSELQQPFDVEFVPNGNGYLVLDKYGRVHAYGSASFHGDTLYTQEVRFGSVRTVTNVPIAADLEIVPDPANPGNVLGYYILDQKGTISEFGNVPDIADVPQTFYPVIAFEIDVADTGDVLGWTAVNYIGQVLTWTASLPNSGLSPESNPVREPGEPLIVDFTRNGNDVYIMNELGEVFTPDGTIVSRPEALHGIVGAPGFTDIENVSLVPGFGGSAPVPTPDPTLIPVSATEE